MAEVGEWIEHDGKGMPVDGETVVGVIYRDGFEHPSSDKASYWDHEDPMASNWVWVDDLAPTADITHYRIVKENQDA